ncbi:HD-GYP domain-containing protein [Candidatus Marinarcus aquaticus]|uniref:HD-GYP domain-containing protein n=1 Tax=Candidatus Marinarcus aquaticus TaxID=2044504 RepID=A0A4Q0XVF3_9BACT|nr:HD-GYP domain-containing protein [Candidatus Marinarcus aquaticus]RXJ60179.1 hypothetical protein CRV04_04030 [Candidatus Marinarcus aquaticus]
MSVTEVGHKYYLIDKIVITLNSVLTFDLYKKDEGEKPTLMLHKHMPIVQELYDNEIQEYDLYVHEDEKQHYDLLYKTFSNKGIAPQKMLPLYNHISENVHKLFQNPESMTNYKVAKSSVSGLVSTVLSKDFGSSSFLSVLVYDYYTHTHSLNVCVYAVSLGRHLGMGKDQLEELGIAALLHDIGKSKIDEAILYKEGKLSEDEFKKVKEHPVHGWNILKLLGIKNKNILAGVRSHHEKLDGTGYPDGLKSKEIHIYAKIIGMCDVFDAITTNRSYNDPKSTFETLIMMKKEMRNHLDTVLINHFIMMLKEQATA